MNPQLNIDADSVDHAVLRVPLCVEPSATIAGVLERMKSERRGCALVCRDQVLIGIFTERDALGLMARQADLSASIESVMVSDPITITPGATVGDAVRKMASRSCRRLPVVDDKMRPVGLATVAGILDYLARYFPNVVYTLPPEPHHNTQEREGA